MKAVIKNKPEEEKYSGYPRLEKSEDTEAIYLVTRPGHGMCVCAGGLVKLGDLFSGSLSRGLSVFTEQVVLEN